MKDSGNLKDAEILERNKNLNRGFRKLRVWREAVELYVFVKETLGEVKGLSFKIRDQILDFFSSKQFLKSFPILFGFIFFREISKGTVHNQKRVSLLSKCAETFLYPFKRKANEICDAELLSIVVDKESQGIGIAEALLKELKNHFSNKGVDRFKVVAGEGNKRACRFYEKHGGKLATQIEVHCGDKSNVYLFNSR